MNLPDKFEDLILYHGSTKAVRKIDLSYGEPYKDFGVGFYLTSDISQAKAWARLRTNARGGRATVSKFILHNIEGLNVKIYKQADAEWLDFIC